MKPYRAAESWPNMSFLLRVRRTMVADRDYPQNDQSGIDVIQLIADFDRQAGTITLDDFLAAEGGMSATPAATRATTLRTFVSTTTCRIPKPKLATAAAV